jgi:hypothetical protein
MSTNMAAIVYISPLSPWIYCLCFNLLTSTTDTQVLKLTGSFNMAAFVYVFWRCYVYIQTFNPFDPYVLPQAHNKQDGGVMYIP